MPLHVALFDDWSHLCTGLQAERTGSAFTKLADLLLVAGKHPARCAMRTQQWLQCFAVVETVTSASQVQQYTATAAFVCARRGWGYTMQQDKGSSAHAWHHSAVKAVCKLSIATVYALA